MPSFSSRLRPDSPENSPCRVKTQPLELSYTSHRKFSGARSLEEQASSYPCGGDLHKKESLMFTLFFIFVFFVLMVPLTMAAQGWLFKETDEVYDREWALYQQRYD